jgi:hypothetical protein
VSRSSFRILEERADAEASPATIGPDGIDCAGVEGRGEEEEGVEAILEKES